MTVSKEIAGKQGRKKGLKVVFTSDKRLRWPLTFYKYRVSKKNRDLKKHGHNYSDMNTFLQCHILGKGFSKQTKR